MLFAHDNGAFDSWTFNETPADSIKRIEREWRMDETGDIGSVKITVNPDLLPAADPDYNFWVAWLDSDGDFTSGARAVPMTFDGTDWVSDNVDVQDGDYVTFGIIRPFVEFTTNSSSGDESVTDVVVEAQLSTSLGEDVTVDYSAYGGTATGAGDDYTLASGTITIVAGTNSGTFNLSIVDDPDTESDENILMQLQNPSAGLDLGAQDTTEYIINDNDNTRTIDFTISSSSGTESSATANLTVRISSVDNINPTTVDYAVTGGSADGGGVDFTLAAGTATVLPGDVSTIIQVDIVGDDIFENDETVIVGLSNPLNANLGANTEHTYTIINDDSKPELVFEIQTSSASEDIGSTDIKAVLTNPTGTDISFDYVDIAGGTASSGSDYTISPSTLTIAAGDTSASFSVTIINDTDTEPEETAVFRLTNLVGSGAALGAAADIEHTLTITDDDYTGFRGPGGVGDQQNNKLWLSADSNVVTTGADVLNWLDLSGNANHASNLAPGQEPDLVSSVINGRSVVRFDDNGGSAGDYLGANTSLGISGAGASTVFMVAKNTTTSDEDNSGLFIGQASGNPSTIRHYGLEYDMAVRFNNGNRVFDDGFTQDDWKIGIIRNFSGALYGEYEGFVNGGMPGEASSAGVTNIPVTVDDLYYIGAGLGPSGAFSSDRYFEGDMAEMIAYNIYLNNAQVKIVNNYLSSKYGLPVLYDLYAHDGLYGEDVAGIGREAIDTLHTAAMSSNILLVSNALDLDDDEYLMFGHNGDTLGTWVNAELPAGSIRRIAREWRIDETGDPGSLAVSIDTNYLPAKPSEYNNYVLLVDNDNDFSSGATIYPMSLTGDFYSVSGLNPGDDEYITIAVTRPEVQFTSTTSNDLEDASPALLELSLNFAYKQDITVDYAVSGGSAGASDYSLPGSSVTIPAGSTTANISLTINDDAIVEADEIVIVDISNPSIGFLGTNTSHTYTINDNDNARTAEFTATPATGNGDEGLTPILIEVGLNSSNPDTDSKIAYEATGGTATDGSDFFFSNDTLVIPAGDLTADISLSIIEDALFENAETIEIELIGTGSLNTNLGANTLFTYTINDNDAAPEVSFSSGSGGGLESFQTVYAGIQLSAVSDIDAQVDYDITGLTATGGSDFTVASGTITIPAGESSDSVLISIIDDIAEETAENLQVALSNPVNCTVGATSTFVYTIQDDDGLGWEGPGGVANFNQNKVWLNAYNAGSLSNGDNVGTWPDVTSNNHDAVQTDPAQQPLYLENMWNSRPVVQFNSGFSQFLNIPDHTDINTGGPYDKKTIIVSFRTGSDISTRQVLYEEGGGVRGLNIYIENDSLYLSGWNENNDDGGLTTPWSYIDVDTVISPNTPYYAMLQFNFDGGSGGVTGWLNGALIDTLSGAGRLFAHPGDIGVGAMDNDSYFWDGPDGGEDHYFNGYIGELIVSNIVYNQAQQKIVNNYLAAKYGISIANDYYDHQNNYGYELFGIGQDDLSNSHAIAQGAGVIRIDNPSGMDNGEYLLAGHNGDPLSWTDVNVPDSDPNIRRSERIWRTDDRTNSIGTVRLGADMDGFDPNPFFGNYTYVLITDDDGDFTSGYTMVELVEDASTGLYTAQNIDLSNDKYFTVGVIKPTIRFTVSSDLGSESVSPVDVEVSLNFRTSSNVSADLSVIGIEAIEDDDFTIGVSSVLIPAGSRSTTFQLDILNDTDPEADERIELELSNPTPGIDLGANTTYTYTIQDDDNLRSIEFTNTTATNDESVTSYNIEVTLDIADPANPTTVNYEVTGGTASGLGVDYTLVAGVLSIPANNTTGTIPLSIIDDVVDEPDETVVVTLSAPTNANLGANQVFTYTVVDNDLVPNLSFSAPLSGGGAESFSPVRLYLEMDNASGNDVTVYYSSSGGTANNVYAGDYDYVILDESYITIPAGSVTDSLEFSVFNDIIEEPDETIVITIDSVRNASLVPGSSTFTYTIYDDDGKGFIGPGGVGDGGNYQVWLKSDSMPGFTDGDAVTTWPDVSGNSHDASQGNGSRKPDYRDNLTDNVNERPVVLFDGSNDGLGIADDPDFNTGGPYTTKTLIASFETGSDITSRQVIYEQGGSGRGLNIYIEGGQLYIGGYNDANDDATTPWLYIYSNTPVAAGNTYTAMLEYEASAGEIRAYLNGSLFGTASGAGNLFAHGGDIGLGFMNNGSRFHTDINSGENGEGYYFTGKILEFLSYNTLLTEVQNNLMNNYFASKYGHAPGTELFTYDATNSYEVFGMGRFNSTSHIISKGTGLVLIDEPQSLDEGDYLMIGHDNANKDTWTTSGLPAGYTGVERLEREWIVDKTNDIGAIRIAIDTSAIPARPAGYDNYILFIDDDGDLGNGGTRAEILSNRYGKYVRKGNISLDDGNVFFIGVGRNITVQDGNWNDPNTWLLNVPAGDEEVTVSHNVTLTANTQVGGVVVSSASGLIDLGSYSLDITEAVIDTVAGGNINSGTGEIIYSADAAQCIEPLIYYDLTVSGNATKTLCGDIVVTNDLTILNTGTTLDADAANNYSITLNGDWQSNGTFNAQNGKVLFDGTSSQNINRNTGDNEIFYDFEIGAASSVLSDHNVQVEDTLLMNGGNFILASGKVLTIGVDATDRGALVNNSGYVVGKLVYWLSSTADDNRDILYPLGTSSNNRSFVLNATNISNSGRLQLEFVESDPLDQGLPLNDGLFVVDGTFNEGYWKMTFAGGFSIDAAVGFDIDAVADGFGSYPLTENSRLLSRYSSGSDWLLNGTHASVLTDTVRRNGITTMTYEYAVGHVIECTPVFTSCPTDITQNNDPGDCGAIVSWTAPAPEAICTALTVTNNFDPGDFFPVGITEVVYYLWDGPAKVDSCKFNVEIIDNEDPVANCKDITVTLDATGNASIVAADVDNGSTDNCGIASLSIDVSSFTCADQGEVPVTLTVIDNSGNTSTCVSNVTVESSLDITSLSVQSCNAVPGIAALYDSDVVGGDGNYTYFWDGLDDSVDPFMTITLIPFSVSTSNTSTDETPLLSWFLADGTYEVALTVTDGNGCTDTDTLIFTKDGLTTDNISVLYTGACEGSTVTYTVGYDADATYAWEVENGTIISAITDTNEIDVTWDLAVTDGVVKTNITEPSVFGDCESSVIDSVSINPVPAPSFIAPVAVTTCLNSTETYTLSTTYNNYAWTVTGGSILAGGSSSDDYATVQWTSTGTGNVEVAVTTAAGCSNTVDADVAVYEVTATIDAQTDESCPGASDGEVTVSASGGLGIHELSIDGGTNWFTSPHTFSGLTSGSYTVQARDAIACTDNVPVNITVADLTPPTVICQDITVSLDVTGNASIVAADVDNGSFDACGIQSMTIDVSTFDCSDVGPNNVILTVTDNSGNSDNCTAVVTIIDDIDPSITCPPGITVECTSDVPAVYADYAAFTAAGGSAFDNCGIDAASLVHTGDVTDGNTCPEIITRTYQISDANGNTATCDQTITVNDVTAPTASDPAPISVECLSGVPAPDISVVTDEADNCTASPVVAFVGDVSDGNTCPEVITRTYSVTDDCGNSITVDQTITVNDITTPTMTAPPDITVECLSDVPAAYANYVQWTAAGGTASDNCGINTASFTMVNESSDGNTCPELITRIYQIEDNCGNIGTVAQSITVDDITPPTLTSPAPLSFECGSDVDAPYVSLPAFELAGGTAVDNCGIDASSFTWISDVSDNNTCPETITRTYEVADNCGNASQITQTITVNDITAPTASDPSPVTVECSGDVPAPDVTVVDDEADNCTAAPVVAFVGDVSDGNTCPETITRTYSVTDDCG
ncbi:MAG: HYR domain-containing protein, partial [Bacteroidales bacterium]|nr:HYR domain-containing protein [Bacteroidales bacterium]